MSFSVFKTPIRKETHSNPAGESIVSPELKPVQDNQSDSGRARMGVSEAPETLDGPKNSVSPFCFR